MKNIPAFMVFCLASLAAQAQTPDCTALESRLRADVGSANGCKARHQACKDLGSTNHPMRELNYCQNLLKGCESLDGPIGDDKLRGQIERFRKQCP